MVLVDSSVWIAYLSDRPSTVDAKLAALIQPDNQVAITGLIFQEVLQGIKNDRSFYLTQQLLMRLPHLNPTQPTHLKAAGIYRKLCGRGKTLTTINALIAALSIENEIPLFTLDEDFKAIENYTSLQLLQ